MGLRGKLPFFWRVAVVAIIGAAGTLAHPASATTYIEEEFTCPIGGEKFEASVMASNYSAGKYPDGRNIGGPSLRRIPECPGNGFLIFKDDFTPDELAILDRAIQTSEYAELRKEKARG